MKIKIICKKLENGISRRYTRYTTKPGNPSRFKLIYPSFSLYELAISKPNNAYDKLYSMKQL